MSFTRVCAVLCIAFHASVSDRNLVVENRRYPNNADMAEKIKALSYLDTTEITDGPFEVKVQMFIESISSFKTSDMSFAMDFHLHLTWKDERFAHNESQPFLFTKKKEVEYFWIPDLYFANSHSASYQDLLKPNTFIRLYPDGEVHLAARVTLTASCSQDLREYPMDRQYCGITMRSYSHPTTKVIVKWFDRNPISGERGVELPELDILGYVNGTCDSEYTYAETDSHYMKGNFSCLFGGVRLRRLLGYHMVQTYIPTGLIVVISWVSFFIDPSAVPARVSLSFTTLLTLSTMAAGVRVALPPVAYAKAIDIWVGVCMLFVFSSLLQFALVNSYMRGASSLDSLKFDEKRRRSMANKLQTDDSDAALLQRKIEDLKKSKMSSAKRIDRVCRMIFPGTFLLFNIFYWIIYLH